MWYWNNVKFILFWAFIPALFLVLLYSVIKEAVKKALIELKEEDICQTNQIKDKPLPNSSRNTV